MLVREDEDARFPGPNPLAEALLLLLLRVSRDARLFCAPFIEGLRLCCGVMVGVNEYEGVAAGGRVHDPLRFRRGGGSTLELVFGRDIDGP